MGISPSGAITFLSDVYEGSISDKDITVKSGLVKSRRLSDCRLGILNKGYTRSTENRPQHTPILTKRIARVSIHVERAIERMKKFKIIGTTIPLSLKSVATEIVHIIGFLVNYQSPLVK